MKAPVECSSWNTCQWPFSRKKNVPNVENIDLFGVELQLQEFSIFWFYHNFLKFMEIFPFVYIDPPENPQRYAKYWHTFLKFQRLLFYPPWKFHWYPQLNWFFLDSQKENVFCRKVSIQVTLFWKISYLIIYQFIIFQIKYKIKNTETTKESNEIKINFVPVIKESTLQGTPAP